MCDLIRRQDAIDAILAVTGNSSVRELYEHVQEHGLSDMWSGGVNAAIDIIIAVPPVQPDLPIKEKCAFCPHCTNCDVNDDLSIQPCVDTISRQAAIDAVYKCDDIFVGDMPVMVVKADAYEALAQLPSAQPDLSGYSDKLWKAAYERGKAEAQAEIVRCKDCKHRTSYWGNCRLLEEKYHQSVLVDGDSFCSMAERRTDE